GAGAAGQPGGGVFVHSGAAVRAGPVQGDGGELGGGQGGDLADQGRGTHSQGEGIEPTGVQVAQHGVGGGLLVHDEHVRVGAGGLFPVVAERENFPGLGGVGDIGVGVDEVVSAGVLCEEGDHGAGALGAGGHVVLFQRGVGTLVHDRVEVQ